MVSRSGWFNEFVVFQGYIYICDIQVITECDIGSGYHIMILTMENIKFKYKYDVVGNMKKFISYA